MKKDILLLFLIIISFFSGCNQIQDTNTNEPTMVSFESLHLLKTEHPELDFGFSRHDGQRIIRDFAVTKDGNLLLFELSDKVYEYSAEGKLLRSYDFGFQKKGLTAYMFTCDNQGNFYFVDGHNCLIIKADRDGILNTASLGEKSIITEPGLIKGISTLEENILIITAISPEDFITYTYELNVSGDDAFCITEPQVGIVLGNGLSYKNELITNEDGGLTNGTFVTIYKDGVERNKFEIHSRNNFIAGLNIYGLTQSDKYLGRIFEILPDGNTIQETFVIIDVQEKVIQICDGFLKNDDIVKGYNDNTFVLRFDDDGIIIFPLHELFTTSKNESWFKLVIDNEGLNN